MSIKIAFVGAGSLGFTRGLIHDILTVPEFKNTHFSLMDISRKNLDMVSQLVERDIKANKLPAKVTSGLQLNTAVKDADYIICTIRQGGLEAFKTDIEIPLQYGIDQCVGDTLCAGGIMYGQRGIPALLDICKAIKAHAKPGAMLLNYANPMAMNTWACNTYGGVPTLGLCHGVEGGHRQIANVLGKKKEEVNIIAAGINHQTWYIRIETEGRLIGADELLKGFEKHPNYSKEEKARIDVLKRIGYYSTESNGHLSEYLPWYRKRPKEIKKWINMSSWINGETGGYLRVCTEGRNWFETDFPNWMKEPAPVISTHKRSGEHGSYIIEALETGRVYRGHFNVPNNGCITNLPDDCMIEVPCYADKNGINIPKVGALPLACAASLNNSVSVQRMSVEAAIKGDLTLLKQAMLHDPLTAAVCNPEEIWQLTDKMLVAQAKWLPQYKKEISGAKKRLSKEVNLGTNKSRGAARIKTKTVAEMNRDKTAARKNAAAADKAGMTKNA